MAALTVEKDNVRYGDDAVVDLLALKTAANVKIFKGALVSLEGGYARPARTNTTDLVAGVARKTVDNLGGLAGALDVEVRRGLFTFENSAAADAIAQDDVGLLCYVVDDQTVALTNGGATRGAAGRILGIDPSGKVLVQVGIISGSL